MVDNTADSLTAREASVGQDVCVSTTCSSSLTARLPTPGQVGQDVRLYNLHRSLAPAKRVAGDRDRDRLELDNLPLL